MAIWSGLGVNYGHILAASYSSAQTAADLNYLWSLGFRKIRVAFPYYTDTSTLNNCKDTVVQALDLGFYVIWGVAAHVGFTQEVWDNDKANVLTLAAWAQTVGGANFEFSIGNEEDSNWKCTVLNRATVRTDLLAQATAVQAIYTLGPVSYQTDQEDIDNWIALGQGDLDRIGFNVYDTLPNFKSHIAKVKTNFPTTGDITEWGDQSGYTTTNNEDLHGLNVRDRLAILRASGISNAYFFTYYNDGSYGLDEGIWNLKRPDGSFRTAFWGLIGGRWSTSTIRFSLPSTTQKSLFFVGTANNFAESALVPSATGFCIGFWIYSNQETNNRRIMSWYNASGGNNGLDCFVNSGGTNFAFNLYDANVTTASINYARNTLRNWKFVTLTFVPNSFKLYVDSVLQSTDTSCSLGDAGAQLFTIGDRSDSHGGVFKGFMKNITFHNTTTPWTQDQIRDLYYRNTIPSGAVQWAMNDSATDQNGANALTLTGTSYSTEVPRHMRTRTAVADRFLLPSATQKSLSFNGTTDFGTVPIVPSASGFNLGFWLKDRNSSANGTYLDWRTAGTINGIWVRRNSVNKLFQVLGYDNNSILISDVPTPPKFFDWNHWVLTYVANSFKIYLNNVLISTDTSCTIGEAVEQLLTIGRVSSSSTTFGKFLMKNLTLHNTATPWTVAQINDLYYRNIIPSGATQWSMNDVATDQNGTNALTLTGTSYSTDVPPHMRVRTLV